MCRILFTPTWNTAVFWYAAGILKVRVSLCSQNGPPPPPKPLQIPWFISWHIATAQLFQWVMLFEARLALFIVRPAVHCGLKYQLWPPNRTRLLPKKVVSCVLYPYNSDKTNPQKSDIYTKINVFSHRSVHRCASCSAGVICRGCGVVTCNKQLSTKNVLGTLE